MVKILPKINKFFFLALIFLTPLLVLPFTADFFLTPKVTFFAFGVLTLLIIWLGATAFQKKAEFTQNSFIYPLFLIFIAHLFSLFANWNNLDKFVGFWTIIPFFFFLPFSFLVINFSAEKNNSGLIKNFLLLAGVLVSASGILFFLLPTNRYPLNLSFGSFPLIIPNASFSLTGNNLTSLIFLISLIPFLLKDFSELFAQEKISFLKIIVKAVLTLIIITGSGIYFFQIVSVNQPLLLPGRAGWAIAVETLKNPVNALFGVGPGQFLTAFTRFKPINLNLANLWSIRFFNSSTEIMQVITTLGLVGLAAYFYLIGKFLKLKTKGPEFFAAGVIILSFFFLPGNFLFYFLLVIFLSQSQEKKETQAIALGKQTALVVTLTGLVVVVFSFYLLGRNFLADLSLRSSIIAAEENKGLDTYNLQIRAISLNPYRADFHELYSQTNLALANNLATKKELTDQDKQTISQLVQQAIREGRNAVSLAPLSVGYWENLSSIYRQLINFAQGADQWAIASLNQVIKLDPNNPQAYLNLGGLYYSLSQFDQAASLFQTSVALKPDFANGWYNLAAVFKERKDYQKAFDALNQTVKFIDVNSPDFQKVQKEIEEVKENLPKPPVVTPAPGEETLKLPEPIPSPKAQITPIELPKPEEATQSSQ